MAWPVIAAMGASALSNIMGQQAQSSAMKSNVKAQERQWQQYLETLTPEWRFTPEQLSLQEAMIPQYQAQMGYATGLKDLFYTPPEMGDQSSLQSQMGGVDTQISSLQAQIAVALRKVATRSGFEKQNAAQQLRNYENQLSELQTQKGTLSEQMKVAGEDIYTTPFEQEFAKQQQMGQAQQLGFEQMAGESLGQIGQSQLEQQQQIMGAGRQMFGNATAGQTLQQLMDVSDQSQMQELKAKMYPEQAMMQYKQGLMGQAQQGLQDYMTLPLGNLPAGGAQEPLYQQADMTRPNMINDMMSTYMMYNMMNQGEGQTQQPNQYPMGYGLGGTPSTMPVGLQTPSAVRSPYGGY